MYEFILSGLILRGCIRTKLDGGQSGGIIEVSAVGKIHPRIARCGRRGNEGIAQDHGLPLNLRVRGHKFSIRGGDAEPFQRPFFATNPSAWKI